jgi:hypothetical protein
MSIEQMVREQFAIIETGDVASATGNVTADFVNHRAVHEPLAARGRGPDALAATVRWLRRLRIADGAIAGHDAVRDDLGIARQVGWLPPRPSVVLRRIVARWREGRR